MIDYRSHLVALASFESELAAATFGDPAIASGRDHQLADVGHDRGMAALGSLIDHLLHHAASDGQELALLERAAALWNEGLEMHASLGQSRSNIESALLAPAHPDSAGLFNEGAENIRKLALNASGKLNDIDTFRQDVMKLSHIPEHPRQAGLQLSDWGWGDVFLARRTDAFLRTIYRDAQDHATRSFAFGVLSSYAANVCGSAYLEQAVGGPRRSHRFRNRIASNAVGSWFARTHPDVERFATIADSIRFGPDPGAPTFPPQIESLVTDALHKTYDLDRTAPLPDLKTGYSRLIRHLELLDTFTLPPAPPMPAAPFLAKLFSDPSNPPAPLFNVANSHPGSGHQQGPGSSHPTNYAGTGSKPTTTDSAPTTGERCGHFWLGLVYAVMWLGGGFAPCIGAWAQGNHCTLWDAIWDEWAKANQPSQEQMEALAQGSAGLTAEQFSAAAGVDQMTRMVGYTFDLHNRLWEGLGATRAFLAIHGLIPPDDMLNNPVYAQFLAIPTAVTLPLRPEVDPVLNYHDYPPAIVENPPYGWAPYPTDATPDVFTGPATPNTVLPTASRTALQTWTQIARGDLDALNYDLDADRGYQFPCWSAQGSIESDPINVQTLAYEDM